MPPPQIGKSKLKLLSGDSVLPERRRGGRGEKDVQFVFCFEDPARARRPSAFNVLYVETPRIGIFQLPAWRGFAEVWGEAMEMVKPILRFGIPQHSMFNKCPHYE